MTREPAIEAAARTARAHFDGVNGFPNEGRLNLYQCESNPEHLVISVDREPGVTPFTIQCPICEERGLVAAPGTSLYRYPPMRSACYRVHPHLTPTFEWYRPDSVQGLSEWAREHVLKGGLLIRRIGETTS